MRSRFRTLTIATLSVSALTLAACGSGGGSSDSTSGGSAGSEAIDAHSVSASGDYNIQERDALQDGGTLTLPLAELSQQQNTWQADGNLYTKNVWKWYNPQLSLFDGDGTWHANPDYLTDVKDEVVDGNTVLTYTIHPDATFNDGTPIDWTTFEHTWKFSNGENEELNVSSTDGYELIKSVERGENDKQAVVTFDGSYAWWQGLFGFLLHNAVNTPDLYNTGYLGQVRPEWGAGPYKVENVNFNTGEISFVQNENWWGDTGKLDKIIYRQMEDQASLNALRAGEIDASGVATKDRLATAKEMGDKLDIRTALLPANYLMTVNSKSPMLEDIKVREAVMTAVDREQIAAIRFNGLDYTEDLPGSFALFQTQEGYENNFGEVLSFDADRAKTLLDEAGWTEGANGIREKDGQPLTLRYVITGESPMVQATAGAIQAMLKNVGVDVQIQERPSSEFSQVTSQRDFDIFLMGFRSGDPFGVAYFGQVYLSDSELNLSGTGTPELDTKIRELQRISDPDEQIARANVLEQEAMGTFGIMPYANGPEIVAVKPGLANYGAMSFAEIPVEDIGWEK